MNRHHLYVDYLQRSIIVAEGKEQNGMANHCYLLVSATDLHL